MSTLQPPIPRTYRLDEQAETEGWDRTHTRCPGVWETLKRRLESPCTTERHDYHRPPTGPGDRMTYLCRSDPSSRTPVCVFLCPSSWWTTTSARGAGSTRRGSAKNQDTRLVRRKRIVSNSIQRQWILQIWLFYRVARFWTYRLFKNWTGRPLKQRVFYLLHSAL